MNFLFVIFFLLIGDVICYQKSLILSRTKRWNKGDMQNNGGINNNGGMANNGDLSENFRGTAGVDYPDFKSIPQTNFRCDDQQYEGGLYADVETQCQVYHVCHDGRKDSFLCGQGTVFNQEILACDYWYSTDCDKAPSFYYVNSQIGNSGSSWQSRGESPQQGNHQGGGFQDGSYRSGNPNVPQQGGYDNTGISGGGYQDGSYGSGNPNIAPQGGYGNTGNSGGGYQDGSYRSGNPNIAPQGGYGNTGNSGGGHQDGSYRSGNPNVPPQGGYDNSGNLPQPSGTGTGYNPQNPGQKDCSCQKYSFKTPWSFPSS